LTRQHRPLQPDDGSIHFVAERCDFLLYDRMVAYHLTRNETVPLTAAQFYAGLKERFVPRDGMYFLPEQIPEYEQALRSGAAVQQLALFVSDEKSAIQWLRQHLDPATGGAPATYQDIQPAFLQQLHQARHEALPELQHMLEENCSVTWPVVGVWPTQPTPGDWSSCGLGALLREVRGIRQG
jgi:hypothetical protein